VSEFDRIRTYLSPLAGEGSLQLRDDGATLSSPAGTTFVVTTDSVITGVHCIGDESPALMAHKLVRRNLSDIAAMGARPYAYLLSLMLPKETTENWWRKFTRGLSECQDEFGIFLLGGDTACTLGVMTLSLTAFGTLTGTALTRSGAVAGDNLYITGTLGDAALGLAILLNKVSATTPADATALIQRYRVPQPRIAIGLSLQGCASACMDISDGLMQDAAHLARCSDVALRIDAHRLPLSSATFALRDKTATWLEYIVNGGDDYELLFTAPSSQADSLAQIARSSGVAITKIGHVTSGNGVTLHNEDGTEIKIAKQGWQHF
jgi:thiamine-monophosphate kinase